ncbi:unnamed protein product [Linum trigynum]|uniref:Uncharacterized protein n=1 Tax=Linum trigynum TaxID=586398 RepID=A0AAV2EIQ7_9ROSI
MVSVLLSVKMVVSSPCVAKGIGPPVPVSVKILREVQYMVEFGLGEHNKALSRVHQLKLVSIDGGAYYSADPEMDFVSFDITASNRFGRAKYNMFVTRAYTYNELKLKCFEKI